MEKGEIACFEQFHLLSQCFKKLSAAEAPESVFMLERDKAYKLLASIDLFDSVHFIMNKHLTDADKFKILSYIQGSWGAKP